MTRYDANLEAAASDRGGIMEPKMARLSCNIGEGDGMPTLGAVKQSGAAMAGRRGAVGRFDEPETLLEVEFVGLTEAEQEKVLAAFPGGRRFILRAS